MPPDTEVTPTNIAEIQKVVIAAAQVGNSIEKALNIVTNGGSFLAKLQVAGELMNLAPTFVTLSQVSIDEFKKEASDLSRADLTALLKSFDDTLQLKNTQIEYTIEHLLALVEETVEIAINGVSIVKDFMATFAPKTA